MYKRSAGILLPVSSLPSRYGIGTFGSEAYKFVDFLQKSGQACWQILPAGPVAYGDSPYSPLSVYAGNPYFIDLEMLAEQGLLSLGDCEALEAETGNIDYGKQFRVRYTILEKAFRKGFSLLESEIRIFEKGTHWISGYTHYMALKYKNGQKPWYEWETEEVESEEKDFWLFLQYLYHEQYFRLKEYAASQGIAIIGDMPVYAAYDSADVWSDPHQFLLNEKKRPILVAGVPPDYFSKDGQLWGNPVYDWEYMKGTGYSWWINRLAWSLKLYDMVRIDHFRGFDEFWAVPFGEANARKGSWMPAGGREVFEKLEKRYDRIPIIAEDLGIINDSVEKLRTDFAFPGMKVLQFAFDGNPDNPYLPENYEENCVAFTGTHDNDTLKGWFDGLDKKSREQVLSALRIENSQEVCFEIIRILYESKAGLCIIPLQDFLGLGREGRINTPSTRVGNWVWRAADGACSPELSDWIRKLTSHADRSV
ncbi:4-alpha-glucanotransferase [Parasporobacterium paucivorans]|uniref:4-alpha-glucanotransferase n=1 Tax=Parasporobacterium paucivorans DSM 15970 TaxID=1122934 RepID=A0A1M6G6P4_9FIRM|nr:4-alpha-glucanotransferase [Parasporobacterium paucivorans]SHJ05583.1 4-alpha-glucanotransferase [Parasporobacterium paucivorans DSM 15970]